MRKEEKEEKKPVPWEMTDPKPPVIQSGHMEARRHTQIPNYRTEG